MMNKSNTTFDFKEYELLYFNGDNYQPSNTFFHHNLWMYLTFLIQGIGVLMNSYLIWLINTRLGMAVIINSLLTAECMFRIFSCLVAEPIKIVFLFLGWSPSFLLNIAMTIEDHINGFENQAVLQTDHLFDRENYTSCKTTSSKESPWYCFNSGSDLIRVPFKHIEAMCFLPTCMSHFATAGTCIFVMLISIVRYIYVKTEQAGNRYSPMNQHRWITYLLTIVGVLISLGFFVVLLVALPRTENFFVRACLWPDEEPSVQPLSTVSILYYSTIGTFNTVAFVICAILYCYLYDVEKNSMLNKSPTVLAEVEQVQDVSSQRQPHKSHYFLAGVGLTHIFVCIFFTLAIVLFRYAIPGTNIFETYVVSLMLSLTSGILSPSLVIWSSIDARQQTYKVFKTASQSISSICRRSIHQVAPELDLEHPVIEEPGMDTASKTIGKKTQKIKSREKKSVQIQSNREKNKNHPNRNSAKDKRYYENEYGRKNLDRRIVKKEKITIFNETESRYLSYNSNHMKKSVDGSKNDEIGDLPNSICYDEKEGESFSDSARYDEIESTSLPQEGESPNFDEVEPLREVNCYCAKNGDNDAALNGGETALGSLFCEFRGVLDKFPKTRFIINDTCIYTKSSEKLDVLQNKQCSNDIEAGETMCGNQKRNVNEAICMQIDDNDATVLSNLHGNKSDNIFSKFHISKIVSKTSGSANKSYSLQGIASTKSLSLQSLNKGITFTSPKGIQANRKISQMHLNKAKNCLMSGKHRSLDTEPLGDEISKGEHRTNSETFIDLDKYQSNKESSNCESLKWLILNVSNLDYNGFELNDPTALMPIHFGAYNPTEFGRNSRLDYDVEMLINPKKSGNGTEDKSPSA